MNFEKLKDTVPGEVYYFETTTSTNFEVKSAKSVPDKSLFIAEEQTCGRGRLGRCWNSPKGEGIWMSICLNSDIAPETAAQLTLIAGMAVSYAIPGSKIKWPNDVIIGGKKVAGILTELSKNEDGNNCVIIGIGLNVNTEKFDNELSDKATSLYIETGRKIEREELICSVLNCFFKFYDEFLQNGFLSFKDEYIKRCATLKKEVIIVKNNSEVTAYADGITDSGELIVKINSSYETVSSGEVSVRGLLGYHH